MTNNMVKILEYQTEHFADLTSYTLPEEQAMFSRIPAEVLNNPRIDDETDRFYYTIMYNDKAVGFFFWNLRMTDGISLRMKRLHY